MEDERRILKFLRNKKDVLDRLNPNLAPGRGGGGGTWVNLCWVCAAGLSEPLPHYSHILWPIKDPHLTYLSHVLLGKLTFRALALRQGEWRNCGLCVYQITGTACRAFIIIINSRRASRRIRPLHNL